jgi:hypothetical protein
MPAELSDAHKAALAGETRLRSQSGWGTESFLDIPKLRKDELRLRTPAPLGVRFPARILYSTVQPEDGLMAKLGWIELVRANQITQEEAVRLGMPNGAREIKAALNGHALYRHYPVGTPDLFALYLAGLRYRKGDYTSYAGAESSFRWWLSNPWVWLFQVEVLQGA